ncbi:hypothetical protein B0I35DRAFT_463646 [Stachybotrys elegans]|uniref:NAD(P)-binding domain-containing protein n=1 Tax=Stachybotrys elegans TaxID=80388 RepID=A0A8K0SNQ5_9HYPO|nr:hypothetical protein B0I35DRAFT_463646 [Stachybotrys elegans]
MSSKPVALIFGAGANIGAALVKKFAGAGYRVAAVSRSAPHPPVLSDDGSSLLVRADLYEPQQIPTVFATVQELLNDFPKVVIWNAGPITASPDKDNFFSIPISAVNRDLAISVTSPFTAAAEAVKRWQEAKVGGRFIMTGNIQPKMIFPSPDFVTLGIAKSGSAHWLGTADALYKSKDWRFFFAEERTAEGQPMGPERFPALSYNQAIIKST